MVHMSSSKVPLRNCVKSDSIRFHTWYCTTFLQGLAFDLNCHEFPKHTTDHRYDNRCSIKVINGLTPPYNIDSLSAPYQVMIHECHPSSRTSRTRALSSTLPVLMTGPQCTGSESRVQDCTLGRRFGRGKGPLGLW